MIGGVLYQKYVYEIEKNSGISSTTEFGTDFNHLEEETMLSLSWAKPLAQTLGLLSSSGHRLTPQGEWDVTSLLISWSE